MHLFVEARGPPLPLAEAGSPFFPLYCCPATLRAILLVPLPSRHGSDGAVDGRHVQLVRQLPGMEQRALGFTATAFYSRSHLSGLVQGLLTFSLSASIITINAY